MIHDDFELFIHEIETFIHLNTERDILPVRIRLTLTRYSTVLGYSDFRTECSKTINRILRELNLDIHCSSILFIVLEYPSIPFMIYFENYR